VSELTRFEPIFERVLKFKQFLVRFVRSEESAKAVEWPKH